MARTARKASDLTQRVRRFLDNERQGDALLARLLDSLNRRAEVYLFGGVLRDIALYGIRGLESDIDLVYEGTVREVDLSAEGFKVDKTMFGGFRAKTLHWVVDFWDAERTWALRNHIVEYQRIESLLKTTITNWESILYSVSDDRLLCDTNYFKDLNSGYLHVVLDSNPNPLGMSVKLIRTYAHKGVTELSTQAASCIEQALDRYSFDELSSYEQAHFRQGYIDQAVYDELNNSQSIRIHDMLPVVLTRTEKQESLV